MEWWKLERVIHLTQKDRTRSTHAFMSGDDNYRPVESKDSYEATIDEKIAELSKGYG